MAFGDSITPRIYRNRVPRQVSRFGLMQELHKALIAVGMVYVPSFSRIHQNGALEDLDEQTDQIAVFQNEDSNSQYLTVYDYPDSGTFTIEGEEWKPCVALYNPSYYTSSGSNFLGFTFTIVPFIRKVNADDWVAVKTETQVNYASDTGEEKYGFLLNLVHTYGKTYSRFANSSFGDYNDNFNSYNSGQTTKSFTLWPTGQERHIRHSLWDYYTSNQTHDQLLTVRNVEVVLSKGGLLIQVGSGTRKLSNNNILHCFMGFFDQRIPGRGVPESDDSDKAGTSPVVAYGLGSDNDGIDIYHQNSADFWRLNGHRIGGRFTDAASGTTTEVLNSIRNITWNFTNVDRAHGGEAASVILSKQTKTLNSPRTIGSSGYHILSPMVVGMKWQDNDSTVGLGTRHTEIDVTEIWHNWAELFYSDKWVSTDAIAPAGLFTDPTTNRKYMMFRYASHNCMMGLEVTGHDPIIDETTLDSFMPSHTLVDESQYTLDTGAITLQSGPVAVTQLEVNGNWAFTPSTDELTRTGWTTQSETAIGFELDVSGDPDGYLYEIVYEVYNRGDATTGPSLSNFGQIKNPVWLGCRPNSHAVWERALAGAYRNTGEPASPYEEVRGFAVRNLVDGKLYVSINTRYVSDGNSKDVGIRNIRLRRYQNNY